MSDAKKLQGGKGRSSRSVSLSNLPDGPPNIVHRDDQMYYPEKHAWHPPKRRQQADDGGGST